ncbi:MAG: amidohydrolase family protein [Acidobacteria bacterium]|nr:amidohydrolase family protein [Acidobacteriota bacterium]
MRKRNKRRSSSSPASGPSVNLTRRQLLAGAGAGAAALFFESGGVEARQAPPAARPIVFTHTIVANPDLTQEDVALAVVGDTIADIGPTDAILQKYPNADQYDGRGKVILPGLVNCHGHLGAVLERGYNEDFGFPNSYKLAASPSSYLQPGESTLMVQIAALESIRSGTTTVVAGSTSGDGPGLIPSGLRCVFLESIRDAENMSGPMTLETLRDMKEAPRFSEKLRAEGLQRINDGYSRWHGKENGRVSVFPSGGLAESTSLVALKQIRDFADKHDLGYTLHLSQTTWENDFVRKWQGQGESPTQFLARAGFLGPRFFVGHGRYLSDEDIALLGSNHCIISHQANMAGNRGVIPPIAKLRAAGCVIANGTDNNTNDVFQVMRIALVTERVSRTSDIKPGLRPQPEDMLADATMGGAAAVNQEKTIGSLTVGKKADLFVFNYMKPNTVPYGRIISAIVHCGQSSDIESTMVDGRFLMRGGKVLTMDEAALVAEADRVGRRVWRQVVEKSGPIKFPREPRLG